MIELNEVCLRQGDFELLNLNLIVPPRGYAVLMGPTGSGKTTLVEAICGLKKIRAGRLYLDGVDVTHRDCSQRGIGYVPQDLALFPTMRIDRQIEFGLRARYVEARQRESRRNRLAQLVGIEHLLNRYPRGLSGGEQQRVALARALSFQPQVLCLDEPLSALDAETRNAMVELLRTVHQQEQVTVLHITHNLDDAGSLATIRFALDGHQLRRLGDGSPPSMAGKPLGKQDTTSANQ